LKYCAHTANATKFATSLDLQKGRKGERNPPLFSAVISLITSLAKGHSINKNVLFVHFMQVTLKVIYETEGLLHFFWTKKSKYLMMQKTLEKK